ncbi:type ISP restriction/modification enzyme [Rhodoferax sp.]|uniref:type ISP restriction/modification enzyme n=1 Tax=Rhodoferax sp. TaxID=50421 RepID=UPI0025F9CA9C|nr:type ISP restriction/modification enzyme [Rhodoferax sp.]
MTLASPSHPVHAYLQSLQKELLRGDATEHTHRSALKTLIESAAPGLLATNEPKATQRENKPDYIVRKAASVIGFVEAKDVDKSLKTTLKTNQLKRYLEALPNLMLTNYLDFIWFVGGEKRMEISLGQLNGQHVSPAKDASARWDELIGCFLAEVSPTVSSPSQLAKNLAGQTRLLRDLSLELLTAGDADLLEQEQSFRALLVPDLKPEEFADMYAQTAAYGLFTARVFAHTTMFGGNPESLPDSLKKNDAFSLEQAAYLIPKANPFLRQFFQHVASPNLNPQLRWLVEQIADSLRYTDMEKVLHRQSRKQGFEDPVFHFYETFLAEYDRKLRESRGVYYTPEPVVDYIVRGVDWLLANRFDKPDGLADPSALILDPATGTATFLRKVIALIHQRVDGQHGAGAWPGYVRSQLLPRIFGFELMMAPYTVAHLKLALQLQESGFEFQTGERLHVYLTNTLDQLHQQTAAMLGQWIAKENEGAEKIKLDKPVVVVVGNPPYSGESRNKSDWIMQLLQSYKTEPEGGPLKERNSKWLNDDYVKFIRFAHDRVKRTGHGIVAFITNHGWLDNPTFRGMRAQLMADFDDIYVLDLHGNSKKKERTPVALNAQGDDKNVFDIEQGVSITFLVKLPNTVQAEPVEAVEEVFELTAPEPGAVKKARHRQLEGGKVTLKARIHQADLWGNRDYKYDWLEKHSLLDTPWQDLQPALPQLLLVPRDETDAAEYERGWKVTDIFPMNGTGVITKCDQLNISFSAKECFDKVSWLLAATESDARQRFRLPKLGVRDWSFGAAVSDVKNSGPDELFVKPVLYRPFDQRYLYYTGRSKGLMGWPVQKLFRHFSESPNIGLITSRLTKGEPFAHAQITDKITEVICMSPQTSNNGFVFPLWLLPEQTKPEAAKPKPEPEQSKPVQPLLNQRHPNLSPTFLAALAQALGRPVVEPHGLPEGVTPEDVLAYVYAVLHAPSYRSRYAGFLKSDFPRIPLSNQALAPVNTAQEATDFVAIWNALLPLGMQLIDLHRLKNVPSALRVRFAVQGSNEVEKPRFENGRVWINATQYFDGVPADTWGFKVGGYAVCEKWLKDRKGRQLDFADIQHYGAVVAALTRTRELMQEIDAVANGKLWPEAAGSL